MKMLLSPEERKSVVCGLAAGSKVRWAAAWKKMKNISKKVAEKFA